MKLMEKFETFTRQVKKFETFTRQVKKFETFAAVQKKVELLNLHNMDLQKFLSDFTQTRPFPSSLGAKIHLDF